MRGSGKTTELMKAAPIGAIYIWVNSHLDYPRQLAKLIGREDLQIESPSYLEGTRYYGLCLSGLLLDHAVDLTDAQWEGYGHVKDYIESHLRGPRP